jgi:hypothetical protein
MMAARSYDLVEALMRPEMRGVLAAVADADGGARQLGAVA